MEILFNEKVVAKPNHYQWLGMVRFTEKDFRNLKDLVSAMVQEQVLHTAYADVPATYDCYIRLAAEKIVERFNEDRATANLSNASWTIQPVVGGWRLIDRTKSILNHFNPWSNRSEAFHHSLTDLVSSCFEAELMVQPGSMDIRGLIKHLSDWSYTFPRKMQAVKVAQPSTPAPTETVLPN